MVYETLNPVKIGFTYASMKGDYRMRVGYVRVSTKDQNTERQEVLLKAHEIERLFIEKISGKLTERPQLIELMNFVREGDTVYVESISRFGRNLRHFLELIDILSAKKVKFISLKEQMDTSTPTGKFMLVVFAALAELEREYILERQSEGIKIAKEEGRFNGRPQKRLVEFEEVHNEWLLKKVTACKAAKRLGISRSTFYRRVNELDKVDVIDFG